MHITILLLGFIIITTVISFTYFYLYGKNQMPFMKPWGISWLALSVSIIFLLLYMATDSQFFLEIRKMVDMYNLLFLLSGVYTFMHLQLPTYWYRFSLYLVVLSIIVAFYNFDILTMYYPVTVFQFFITGSICFNIIKRWAMPYFERLMIAGAFALWGLGNPTFMILEQYLKQIYILYIGELILAILLHFSILIIYIQHITREHDLGEYLYKKVVDNAKDAILYYKFVPYEAFEYVTPSIKAMTGYEEKYFYRNPRQYVNLVEPEYLDEITDIFRGQILHDGGDIFKIIRKDGSTFWGEINTSLVHDKDGNLAAVECILRNITEMKSAQLEQIKEKESRDLLLSYISHELRTPVTSIAGYLTALNDGIIKEPRDVSSAMDIITGKTMTLRNLIDDLDELSKMETNQFSFNFMTCMTTEICQALIAGYVKDIDATDHQVVLFYDAEALEDQWVVADELRVHQVFSNLLSNAEKYTAEDSRLEIAFTLDREEENFVVSVKDNGPGIPEEDIRHIFERFYRGHGVGQPGRGLGLTISAEIIKFHNGTIQASNNPEGGCTFSFTIPLYNVN